MKIKVLSPEEVSKILNVNQWTIYRMINSGEIPAFKVGNQWRIREEVLNKWISNRTNINIELKKLVNKMRREAEIEGITKEDIEKAISIVRSD